MGVTLLGYPEHEVWKMTIYKLITLFNIHKEFNADKFQTQNNEDVENNIDFALGGF